MVKKCIVCDRQAEYKIKDTSEYYCLDCAEENFADLSLLIKVEEEAQRLKEYLKEKMHDLEGDEEKLDQMISFGEKKISSGNLNKNHKCEKECESCNLEEENECRGCLGEEITEEYIDEKK